MSGEALWLLPFALQGAAMGCDEFGFHRRRTVPRWEWLGHVLDTAVFLACLWVPVGLAPSLPRLQVFGCLAGVSCLLITKDEFVHQRHCSGGEHWLHAVLFLLHPVVLLATAWLWLGSGPPVLPGLVVPALPGAEGLLRLQALAVTGFLLFQISAGARGPQVAGPDPGIDNTIYDQLGERWYQAADDPVALLRAEARLRTAWILTELRDVLGPRPLAVLDVACGGGFLTNPLAAAGHQVTGIDLSLDSLAVAARHDATGSVVYLPMDARALAFPDGRFDVVCMMDFLEHLEERDEVIREAARVLKPGGLFYFHTFNRTPLAGLIAIKGVAWFVRNTPRHMHIYRLFLKPSELEALCVGRGLALEALRGVRPRVLAWPFFRLLVTGKVSDRFEFVFCRSLSIGYCGRARKGRRTLPW